MATNAFVDLTKTSIESGLRQLKRQSSKSLRRYKGSGDLKQFVSKSEKRRRRSANKRRTEITLEDLGPIVSSAIQAKQYLARREESQKASATKPVPTQAAGTILVMDDQIFLIKDKDKKLLRVPFGSKDDIKKGIVDANSRAAAERERDEEAFSDSPLGIPLTDEDLLTVIIDDDPKNPGTTHEKYFYNQNVPTGTRTSIGSEQEWGDWYNFETVALMIDGYFIQRDHATAISELKPIKNLLAKKIKKSQKELS